MSGSVVSSDKSSWPFSETFDPLTAGTREGRYHERLMSFLTTKLLEPTSGLEPLTC